MGILQIFKRRPAEPQLTLGEQAHLEDSWKRLISECQKAQNRCMQHEAEGPSTFHLRVALHELSKTVSRWPAYHRAQSPSVRQQCLREMFCVETVLRRAVGSIPAQASETDLLEWTGLIKSANHLLRTAMKRNVIKRPPLHPTDVEKLLAGLMRSDDQDGLTALLTTLRGQLDHEGAGLVEAVERLQEASAAWEKAAPTIESRSRRGRGDFLLDEAITACSIMARSDELQKCATSRDELISTIDEVVSFLTGAMNAPRLGDAADFRCRLTALRAQART